MIKGFWRMGMALVLAAPALFGAASIAVSPQNESVGVGKQRQMTATVTGLANPAVSRKLQPEARALRCELCRNGLQRTASDRTRIRV